MIKPEYTVIGDWAVRNVDGHIRHKICRRWCHSHNEAHTVYHYCDNKDKEDENENIYGYRYSGSPIKIPEFVLLISRTMRRQNNGLL